MHISSKKSENFQDSFLQTFNEQLYREKYQLQDQQTYSENNKLNNNNRQTNNNNDSISTLSSSKSTHPHESEEPLENLRYIEKPNSNQGQNQLGGKRGRPMTDKCLIIDEVTSKIYDPDVDPEEYRKARKRIQNRESAVRSRMKKKENNKQSEAELEFLRKENYRLNFENSSLKRERVFLYDQVKFLQGLLKNGKQDNTIPIKPKDENIVVDTSTDGN